MRLLATSYWSFARDRGLLREFRDVVEASPINLHDLRADLDLNRTTLAFTSEAGPLLDLIRKLVDLSLPRIDLARHIGAHPRTGALDDCILTVAADEPSQADLTQADRTVTQLAEFLGEEAGVPTFISGTGRTHSDSVLVGLREGGFGSLLERELDPDSGPSHVHPQLGISLVGLRDFSLNFEARLHGEDITSARGIVQAMTELRGSGDERFLGVETQAFRLPTASETALHVSLTLPDLTPVDPVIQWILEEASNVRTVLRQAVLIGAIRTKDQPGAMRLVYRPEQVAW